MDNELQHYGILGQRWGIRRYQNKDGSLTTYGEKRYNRDQRENAAKKKDNRIDVSKPDANRWVKEDLTRKKNVVDTSLELVKLGKNLERETTPKSTKKRMNLSKMTDQELRQKINRELLEKQYNDLFAKEESPKLSKGRQYAKDVLAIGGGVLAAGSSALGIALAIKELKG